MDNESNVGYYISYYISLLILICIIIAIFYCLFYYKSPTVSEKFEVKHQNKVDNFKAKIQILEDEINKISNDLVDEPNVDKERELFELYYKGVPDTYDTKGKLILGVEPDASKAIGYLQIIINSPYGTEQDVLRLARIYHYGMHLFERNLDKAEEIYNGLRFEEISNETRSIIKEALTDIQKIRIYSWLNLPLERPDINPDFVMNTDPVMNHDTEQQTDLPARVYPIQLIRHIQHIQRTHPIRPIQPIQPIIDRKDYNDPQNTHNPQVLSTIRHSLEKLKTNTPITKNQETTSSEIKKYIDALEESHKKQDALRSLRAIENNLDRLSSTNMTEMDALTLVWNRINDSTKFNKEVSDNLKETMFDELASMQEFGATICSTGRFTHIIDTLNGVDEEVSIKPTYAINEEMLTKSAKIRSDFLLTFPEIERDKLEKGTSAAQEEFDNDLKKTIVTKLREDYVKTGILTEDKFTNQVNSWIDHI